MDFEALAKARAEFDVLVADVRPQLLRYCARMTGSAVDGEDVVQEALAKVYFRLPQLGHVDNLRAWLFRVAHNKALDFLRRYDVRFGETLEGELPAQAEDSPLDAAEVAQWGLSHFVRLTALQRSCVILKDVLSYTLEEISDILDVSVPSIKGALHRGRANLRRQADGAGDPAALGGPVCPLNRLSSLSKDAQQVPALPQEQAALLGRYVALFNARDFDALREMLAEDVRLELVGKTEKSGASEVGGYFGNYARVEGMRLALGVVDGRVALLASEEPGGRPVYCLFVRFRGERIRFIRDYRYARYVFQEAQWSASGAS
jgi:RNA polymerase sigma-70 factor (ECF subfamily)